MYKQIRTMCKQMIVVVIIATLCSLLITSQGQARSLYRGDFVKINENGFGGPPWDNSYSWSMAWFKDKIYVGTMRNVLELRAFSYIPPPFDPYPVPLPDDPSQLDLRAEIWQYTPETDTWRRVYQSEEFPITLPDGTEVWTARDVGYRVMTVYTDQESGEEALYVATNLYIGAEARILRTTDGENFQALTFDPGVELPAGVRLTSFRSLVPFKGRLYTTPVSTGGTVQGSEVQMVFESVGLDLVNSIFHFRPVSPDSFGDETNEAIFEMAVFNGYLYAGTGNTEKGYQIWKTDGVGEAPYPWTPVIVAGAYRGPLNQGTASMFSYKDRLYVGSGIQSGGFDPSSGFSGQPELIRINADDSWQLVCGESRSTPDGFKSSLSGMGPGFNNIFTGYFWRMEEHDDWLYVSTLDNSSYLPYIPLDEYPPLVKDLIELIGIDRILKVEGGFDLWKTRNGIEWYPVTINGFGNPLNIGLRTFQSTPFGLFGGTTNPFTAGDDAGHPGGTEVWWGNPINLQSQEQSLFRGDFVKINENGFGGPPWDNSYSWSMAWFKDKIYVGTMRNVLELRAFSYIPPPFDPYPVPLPDDPSQLDLRAEIWQYTPETDTWRRVYQSEEFPITLPDGTEVWTARDVGYRVMTVYTDQESGEEALYVATNLYIGAEARILRTTDGENFQALTFDPGVELPAGVRLTSFRSLVPFKGRLYTTPVSTGGTVQGSEVQMVFESVGLDLVNSIFHFRPVSPDSFGDETNEAIFEMAVFNGYLYAGTGNTEKGYQIWKTDGVGEAPYPWTPVIVAGAYRGPLNQGTASMFSYKDRLYVGSGIQSGGFDPSSGFSGQPELIRINADDSWQLVCGESRSTPDGFKSSLSGMGPGFNNIFTGYFWRMEEHDDWLYVSTLDNSSYLPYIPLDEYPPLVKDLIELIGIDRILKVEGGFDLWKTRNGIEWYPVTINGFGNPLNIGLRTFQSTPFGLFGGTTNPFTAGDDAGHPGGTEVWWGTPRSQLTIDARDLLPVPDSLVIETQPLISATIYGPSAIIDSDTIELKLDGNVAPHVYEEISQRVYYTSPTPLSTTTHFVELNLEDTNGLPVSAYWSFTILNLNPPPPPGPTRSCINDKDCSDGLFCNGEERCYRVPTSPTGLGTCRDGDDPCLPQEVCIEENDICIECLKNEDCNDELFCTGEETCVDGFCQIGDDPCSPEELCDEETARCLECFTNEDCDDDLFCTGEETCVDGACQPGNEPCEPDELCDEESDICMLPQPPPITFDLIPQSALCSRFIPLPLIMFIRGTDVKFDHKTTISFGDDTIAPPWKVALSSEVIFVFTIVYPVETDAPTTLEVGVTVTTEEGEGTEILTLNMPYVKSRGGNF